MEEQIIDVMMEYPELIIRNRAQMRGTLLFDGVVSIEVKASDGKTVTVSRTIAQTMKFLDACDLVADLIVSAKFGRFTVL